MQVAFGEMNKTLVAVEDISHEKDHFLRVEWNIGKRCNFDCSYCGPSTHDNSSSHLDWPTIEKTIKKLSYIGRRDHKHIKIGFTGGEPYLHPQFLEMVQLCKDEGIHRISVTTNGSVKLDLYKEAFKYVDYLVVSYHMEYARKQKVLENIFLLNEFLKKTYTKSVKHLHVHIMLLPEHIAEALSVVQLLKSNGVNYVVRRIRPQFDKDGEYLRPYSSGMLGHSKPRKDLQDTYYASEELMQMENLL